MRGSPLNLPYCLKMPSSTSNTKESQTKPELSLMKSVSCACKAIGSKIRVVKNKKIVS